MDRRVGCLRAHIRATAIRPARRIGLTVTATLTALVALMMSTTVAASLSLVSCTRPPDPYRHIPPTLHVQGLSGDIAAVRNAITWPAEDGNVWRVEHKVLPPKPVDFVAVVPGSEVFMTLKGIGRRPSTIALGILRASIFDRPEPWKPLYSTTISEISIDKSTSEPQVTFKWTAPAKSLESPEELRTSEGQYCLRIDVEWDDPERPEPCRVEYICRLTFAQESLIERAMRIPLEMSRAAWEGRLDAVSSLMVEPYFKDGVKKDNYQHRPFEVSLAGSWDSILWRSQDCEFSLESEPTLLLDYLRDDVKFPYARASVSFKVKVTDERGRSGICDFQERYHLDLERPMRVVSSMARRGQLQVDDGTHPDWVPKVTKVGAVTKVGPFKDLLLDPNLDSWSDDGKYLAFVADGSHAGEGIWVLSRDGSELRRVYEPDMPKFLTVASPRLRILGWAPNKHKLYFTLTGYQPGPGSHAEDCGVLFAEVDVSSGLTRTVGFIPHEAWRISRWEVKVTQDQTRAFFVAVNDLWQVDLVSGGAIKVFEGICESDKYGFRLFYSPSGWYAAHEIWHGDKPRLAVYDLREGHRSEITFLGSRQDSPSVGPCILGS